MKDGNECEYNLTDEELEARRAYYRQWRRENKDKVHRYNANDWKRLATKLDEEGGEKADDAKN